MLRRALLGVCAVVALSGCAADPVWAPDEQVIAAAYRAPGPTRVTLMTMVSNSTGAGGHSSLMIDGAQRLIFDPAGSWYHPQAPERNDVIFGMSPQLFDFFMDYHARETFHVVVQELDVTPEVAASLSQRVQAYGAVPNSQCSRAISTVLSQTEWFEGMSVSWFPITTMENFGEIPGVRSSQVFDDDSDNNLELLQAQARMANQAALFERISE